MVISELIKVLKQAKEKEGDILVSVSSHKGVKVNFELMSGVYVRKQDEDGKWGSVNTLCFSPVHSTEEGK